MSEEKPIKELSETAKAVINFLDDENYISILEGRNITDFFDGIAASHQMLVIQAKATIELTLLMRKPGIEIADLRSFIVRLQSLGFCAGYEYAAFERKAIEEAVKQ